ncbi:MAG: hypothetical protein RMJ88_07400 [Thermogemmata sp.]|nr:hypothetical protein [Thermogemmata sp.]
MAGVNRPIDEEGLLAARFGWELLLTAGIGKLTRVPGQIGRWGQYALSWDMGQNTVQVGRGGWDIYPNGLTWGNGLQVGGGLLGLGGNYTTWPRLPPRIRTLHEANVLKGDNLPAGMSRSQFGELLQWGTGHASARAQIS